MATYSSVRCQSVSSLWLLHFQTTEKHETCSQNSGMCIINIVQSQGCGFNSPLHVPRKSCTSIIYESPWVTGSTSRMRPHAHQQKVLQSWTSSIGYKASPTSSPSPSCVRGEQLPAASHSLVQLWWAESPEGRPQKQPEGPKPGRDVGEFAQAPTTPHYQEGLQWWTCSFCCCSRPGMGKLWPRGLLLPNLKYR